MIRINNNNIHCNFDYITYFFNYLNIFGDFKFNKLITSFNIY